MCQPNKTALRLVSGPWTTSVSLLGAPRGFLCFTALSVLKRRREKGGEERRRTYLPRSDNLASIKQAVFVCSSCCNKIPYTGWLKHVFPCSFWRLEGQEQGSIQFFLVMTLFLACGRPPSSCVLTWPLLGFCTRGEQARWCL